MIDNGVGFVVHSEEVYAIFGSQSQAETCDNRYCDNRMIAHNRAMDSKPKLRPEAADIFERIDALGIKQRELAAHLGLEENKVSKVRSGDRQFKGSELVTAREWLDQIQRQEGYRETSDMPDVDPMRAYVEVEVLPTYAGAGGGGTGDGDPAKSLIDRFLIEDIFRGKAADFVLIDIRGDSMEPDFRHGDQLLVDRRDKGTAQPGPFAIWDGEWGEYLVKNVERLGDGRVRMFSSNPKYSSVEIMHTETRIIGRPVYFGRRL